MKAAILAGYNKNGRELEIRDVSKPEPGRGEVLVRVSTAGVNPLDNMIVRGEVKLIVPYSFPLVMGNELVGTVEQVGDGVKRFLFGLAGRKFDKMAAKRGQRYRFVFVHEDGPGLAALLEIFGERKIEASIDEVFALEDVNNTLAKVAAGGSKGKTVLRIARS